MQGSLGADRRSARSLKASAGTCRPRVLSQNNGRACYLEDFLLKRQSPLCRRVARQQLTNTIGRALGLSTRELTVVRTLLPPGQSISPAAIGDSGIQSSRLALRSVQPNHSVKNDVQLPAVNELDTASSILAARFASLDANLRSIDSQLQTIASLCRRMAARRQPPSERLLAAFASTTAARDTANGLDGMGNNSLGTVTFGAGQKSFAFGSLDDDVGVRGTWRLRTADDLDRHLRCRGVGDAVVSQVLRNPEGQRRLLRLLMAAAAAALRHCGQRSPAPSPGQAPAAMDAAATLCQVPGERCGATRPGTDCRAEGMTVAASASIDSGVHEHHPCVAGPSVSAPGAAAAAADDGVAEVRHQVAQALSALREVYDAAEPCGGAALSPDLAARGLAAIRTCVAIVSAAAASTVAGAGVTALGVAWSNAPPNSGNSASSNSSSGCIERRNNSSSSSYVNSGGSWQSSRFVATVTSVAAGPGGAAVKPSDAATAPGPGADQAPGPGADQAPGPESNPVLPAGADCRGLADHGAERQSCTEGAAAHLSPGGSRGDDVSTGGNAGARVVRDGRLGGGAFVRPSGFPPVATSAAPAPAAYASATSICGGSSAAVIGRPEAGKASAASASAPASGAAAPEIPFAIGLPASDRSSRDPGSSRSQPPEAALAAGVAGLTGTPNVGTPSASLGTSDACATTVPAAAKDACANMLTPQPTAEALRAPQLSAHSPNLLQPTCHADAAAASARPEPSSGWAAASGGGGLTPSAAATPCGPTPSAAATPCGPTPPEGCSSAPPSWRVALQLAELLAEKAAATAVVLGSTHCTASNTPPEEPLGTRASSAAAAPQLSPPLEERERAGVVPALLLLAGCGLRQELYVGLAGWEDEDGGEGQTYPMATLTVAVAGGGGGSSRSSNCSSRQAGVGAAAVAGLAAKATGGSAAEWGVGRQRRLRLLALLPGAPTVPETSDAVSGLVGAARAVSLALAINGRAYSSSYFDQHQHHHHDHHASFALAKQDSDSAGRSAVAGSRTTTNGRDDIISEGNQDSSRSASSSSRRQGAANAPFLNVSDRLYGNDASGGSSTLQVTATVVALLNDASSRGPWVSDIQQAAQIGRLPPPGPLAPNARGSVHVDGGGVGGLCCVGHCSKQQQQEHQQQEHQQQEHQQQEHQQQAAMSANAAAACTFTAAYGGISRGSDWPGTTCMGACGWEPASGWGWEGAEPPELEFEYFAVVPRRQN